MPHGIVADARPGRFDRQYSYPTAGGVATWGVAGVGDDL